MSDALGYFLCFGCPAIVYCYCGYIGAQAYPLAKTGDLTARVYGAEYVLGFLLWPIVLTVAGFRGGWQVLSKVVRDAFAWLTTKS